MQLLKIRKKACMRSIRIWLWELTLEILLSDIKKSTLKSRWVRLESVLFGKQNLLESFLKWRKCCKIFIIRFVYDFQEFWRWCHILNTNFQEERISLGNIPPLLRKINKKATRNAKKIIWMWFKDFADWLFANKLTIYQQKHMILSKLSKKH